MNGGMLQIDNPRPTVRSRPLLCRPGGPDVARLIETAEHLKYYIHLGLPSGCLLRPCETFGSEARGQHRQKHARKAITQALSEQAR
jgi:hypothetical protein